MNDTKELPGVRVSREEVRDYVVELNSFLYAQNANWIAEVPKYSSLIANLTQTRNIFRGDLRFVWFYLFPLPKNEDEVQKACLTVSSKPGAKRADLERIYGVLVDAGYTREEHQYKSEKNNPSKIVRSNKEILTELTNIDALLLSE